MCKCWQPCLNLAVHGMVPFTRTTRRDYNSSCMNLMWVHNFMDLKEEMNECDPHSAFRSDFSTIGSEDLHPLKYGKWVMIAVLCNGYLIPSFQTLCIKF